MGVMTHGAGLDATLPLPGAFPLAVNPIPPISHFGSMALKTQLIRFVDGDGLLVMQHQLPRGLGIVAPITPWPGQRPMAEGQGFMRFFQ